ncbi:P-loop containing nucleoside triphosphate hydrolase protein [Xylariaceae sp. FL1272]|nr:P-loop containing nucleoside triphosphate hydrolase protein [Xylariaceae sp. FL1272]
MASQNPNGTGPALPVKTREFQNHHMDSRVWNDFKFRPDDIIISSWPKSGTTWVQQIVSQLLNSGNPDVATNAVSPWVEMRLIPDVLKSLDDQKDRRFMKTHLPIDALVWSPEAKYIFVARDPRDAIWSLHNHMFNATDFFYQMTNDTPGRIGPACNRPSEDPRELFLEFLKDDESPNFPSPFWDHMRGWLAARNQPNVLLVHFNDLKANLEDEMRRMAKFLALSELSMDQWDAAVQHCTFPWMKQHAGLNAPALAEKVWNDGADTLINKGTNGRWTDVLTEEDNKQILAKSRQELGEELAEWLEKGYSKSSLPREMTTTSS